MSFVNAVQKLFHWSFYCRLSLVWLQPLLRIEQLMWTFVYVTGSGLEQLSKSGFKWHLFFIPFRSNWAHCQLITSIDIIVYLQCALLCNVHVSWTCQLFLRHLISQTLELCIFSWCQSEPSIVCCFITLNCSKQNYRVSSHKNGRNCQLTLPWADTIYAVFFFNLSTIITSHLKRNEGKGIHSTLNLIYSTAIIINSRRLSTHLLMLKGFITLCLFINKSNDIPSFGSTATVGYGTPNSRTKAQAKRPEGKHVSEEKYFIVTS